MDSLAVMLEAVEKYMGEQFADMLEEKIKRIRWRAWCDGDLR
jgi:hypothetical protein